MPRKATLSKAVIAAAGLEIVRKGGMEALTARALSKNLGCSLSPIFTIHTNMEEIHKSVRQAAVQMFHDYTKDSLNYTPAFKEYGIRLVRFAKEEPKLFQIVFLTPDANKEDLDSTVQACIDAMMEEFDLTEEEGYSLFDRVWIYGCGLALLVSSGAKDYDEEDISRKLSGQFLSVLMALKSGKDFGAIAPRIRENDEKIVPKIEFTK